MTKIICILQLAYLQSSLDKLSEAIKLAKVKLFWFAFNLFLNVILISQIKLLLL